MRRILFNLFIFTAAAFGELPILNTPFHSESMEVVRAQALRNNSDAQMELALRYYAGYQVQNDPSVAFEWMLKAAEQGNSDSQFLMSRMVAEGIGTQADPLISDAWLVKGLAGDPENALLQEQYEASLAEKKNDPDATNRFLQLCSDAGYAPALVALREPEAMDLYSKGEVRKAREIFKQLADQNSPEGFYRLAQMVENGQDGLPEDHIQAFDLYLKAAETEHSEAQYKLSMMLKAGVGTDKDPAEAAKWLEKSAQNGYVVAQYTLAEIKFSSAVRWFEKASLEADNEIPRYEFMKKYKRDLSLSIEWYRKAAEGNISAAQYMLGRLHASGEGVVRNVDQSLQYHQQAAGQGYAESLFYIGLMYHAGSGLPKDIDRAVIFYKKAAELGSRAAMFYLGNCYSFGVGVERNSKKAEEFYRKVLESETTEENAELRSSIWTLRAAREFAIILWQKAGSEDDLSAARKWMSFVARSGDPEAREMLIQMITGSRDDSVSENGAVLISVRAADPRGDAMAKRRDSVFLYPYLQMEIGEIYPDFKIPHIITDATPGGEARSISGKNLWELSIQYKRPSARDCVGLNGTLLMGVELEDKETGDVYWAFNEMKELDTVFSGETVVDVSLFVDVSACPDARISNWTVLYGHLLDTDCSVLAILDQKAKSKSTGSFDEMTSQNRFSRKLDSTVIATIDINARLSGDTPDTPPSDSIIDSVLGTITGQ